MNAKQIFMGVLLCGASYYFVFIKFWPVIEDALESPISIIGLLLAVGTLIFLVRKVIRS